MNKETRIALSISALGLLLFFAVAFTLPFNSDLNKSLFPKPASLAAGSVALTFSPTTSTVTPNEQFDVAVNINPGGQQVTGINLYVKFDPALLQAISTTETAYFPNVFKAGAVDNTTGIASIQLGASPASPKTTSGTIANIKFQAKTTVTTTPSLITISTATPDNVLTANNTWVGVKNFTDTSGNSLNGRGTLGQSAITIQNTAPPPTAPPTASPTPSPTARPTASPSPTATPLSTPPGGGIPPTAPPTASPSPSPTASPSPTPCTLTSAAWGAPANPVPDGTSVSLNVGATGNCSGKQVSFDIRENNSPPITLDSDVASDPTPVNLTLNSASNTYLATTNWTATYQDDTADIFSSPGPEYFFKAKIVGTTTDFRSFNPLLNVNAPPAQTTPSPSPTSTPIPQGNAKLSLTPSSKQVQTGEQFDLNIDLDPNGEKVTGAKIYLKFNPTLLQGMSIAETNYFPNVFTAGVIDNTNGITSIDLGASVTSPKTQPGTAAIATFKAKTTIGNTQVEFSKGIPDDVLTLNNTWVGALGKSGLNGVTTINPSDITITQAPVCVITQAFWSTPTQVTEGAQVTLNVVGNNNCDGQNVAFRVRERDGILEGGLDEDANTQPAPATFIGNTASTTWQAEYNSDGLLGIFDPPEYFFIASVVSGNSTMPSTDPMLEVRKVVDDNVNASPTASSTPTLTSKQLRFLLKFGDINHQGPKRPIKLHFRNLALNFERESDDIIPTVDANGVFTADITTDLPDSPTDIFIKERAHLSKKFTVNLSTGPSINQDYTNTILTLGDVNNDDRINALDIGKIIEDYSGDADTPTLTIADLNLDGKVNSADIGHVITNYLKKGEK